MAIRTVDPRNAAIKNHWTRHQVLRCEEARRTLRFEFFEERRDLARGLGLAATGTITDCVVSDLNTRGRVVVAFDSSRLGAVANGMTRNVAQCDANSLNSDWARSIVHSNFFVRL